MRALIHSKDTEVGISYVMFGLVLKYFSLNSGMMLHPADKEGNMNREYLFKGSKCWVRMLIFVL